MGTKFNCFKCNICFSNKSNMNKHMQSRGHLIRCLPDDVENERKYQCKVCNRKYNSQSSLWKHNQKCKKEDKVVFLTKEIEELKSVINEMKNQQPIVVTNNNNITNVHINFFLNTVCANACSLMEFINEIEYKKNNFGNILSNYENGNMEIIKETFKSFPENRRPLYCFEGDEGKAYIKYNKEWIMQDEKGWDEEIEREQHEVEDDPIGKSMYDLVRLFDKRKMEVFHGTWTKSHTYFYKNKMKKDCFAAEKQTLMVKELIKMATVPKSMYQSVGITFEN